MFRKTSSRAVTTTPALAARFRDMDPWAGERPLKLARLDFLRREAEAGRFSTCIWVAAWCLQDGKTYRLNGQHTSHVLADPEVPPQTVIVEEYECQTLDDVADLYATFDTREAVRTQREVNAVVAAVTPGLENIPDGVVAILVGGICFHHNPNQGRDRASGRDRAAVLRDNVEFCQFFMGLSPDGKHTGTFRAHLCRVGVAAAVYATWLKYGEGCKDFWERVRDGDGSIDPAEATRRLNAHLAEVAATRGKGGRKVLETKDTYEKCLRYWNKYRTNQANGTKRTGKIPELV